MCDCCMKPLKHGAINQDPAVMLAKVYELIQVKRTCIVNDLWEAVAFQSVASDPDKRDECNQIVEWMLKRLLSIGVIAWTENMGNELVPDTSRIMEMPRLILGLLTVHVDKPTMLLYGHLDVDDAKKEDGWKNDPFFMDEADGYLYGRGTSDGKGPLMCWLNAIEGYRDAKIKLPVNILFLIECMATCGSVGLQEILQTRRSIFRNVTFCCIADRRWLGNDRPCVIHGMRGLIYYQIEVRSSDMALHSFEESGTLYEALPDLIYLLNTLTTLRNKISIRGIDANQQSPCSTVLYDLIDYDLEEFQESIGATELPQSGKKGATLFENWMRSSLSIHGIEGAFSGAGIEHTIPNKVIGKFSISVGAEDDTDWITRCVTRHIGEAWTRRQSPNKMVLCEIFSMRPWKSDLQKSEVYAIRRAIQSVHNLTPDFIRDGGALAAASIIRNHLRTNVFALPIAEGNYGGGVTDERISVNNFINGSKVIATFLLEYSKMYKKPAESCVRFR